MMYQMLLKGWDEELSMTSGFEPPRACSLRCYIQERRHCHHCRLTWVVTEPQEESQVSESDRVQGAFFSDRWSRGVLEGGDI